MRMIELAAEYRQQEQALGQRLTKLRAMREGHPGGSMGLYRLNRRIEILAGMQREVRATAELMEHYYERRERLGRTL